MLEVIIQDKKSGRKLFSWNARNQAQAKASASEFIFMHEFPAPVKFKVLNVK